MSTRQKLTSSRLRKIERSLSDRDRSIIESLDRLRICTTNQIGRLHFETLTKLSRARQAPKTLKRLEDLRVVTRLEHQVGGIRTGSESIVWALDVAGQRLASAAGPAGGLRLRRPWTPGLPFVAHRLSVSETYVRLVEAARTGDQDLLDFESEPLCWRRYTGLMGAAATLKPDAFARLGIGDYERGAFIEIDRSTESLPTIARKLTAYRRYWETGREQDRRGYFPEVVFTALTEDRRQALAAVCADASADTRGIYRVVLEHDLVPSLLREVVA